MDLGLHYTLDDANSKLDPEVLAILDAVNPTMSPAFGKVWDLFRTREQPFITDEFKILNRNYTSPQVTVTASGAGADWDSTSATTGLPVSSTTIDRLTIGDVLLVDSEIVVVKAVNRTGNTIDVYERGAGETSPAAHGTSAITAKIIGNACREGTVDIEAMAEQTSVFTNYCQLIEESVDLTVEDTDQARKTGLTEPMLKREAMVRVMRKLARTAVYNPSREGTKAIPAMTRGLQQWLKLSGGIVTNVAGAFTEAVLRTILQDIYKAGGVANAIVMSPAKKVTFNTFSSADMVKQDVESRMLGRIIEAYIADGFGSIPVVVDLDMPDNEVYVVNSNRLEKGWKENDQLRFVKETNTNSRENKQTIQGKFGLAVQGVGTDHGVLTGLT